MTATATQNQEHIVVPRHAGSSRVNSGVVTVTNKIYPVNVYLSAPFFNLEQIHEEKNVALQLENNKTVRNVFRPIKLHSTAKFGTRAWAKQIHNQDMVGLRGCDVILTVLDFAGHDGDCDSGSTFEAGYAVGTGKPLVLFRTDGKPSNLMLTQSCIAYLTKYNEILHYDFSNLEKIHYHGKNF